MAGRPKVTLEMDGDASGVKAALEETGSATEKLAGKVASSSAEIEKATKSTDEAARKSLGDTLREASTRADESLGKVGKAWDRVGPQATLASGAVIAGLGMMAKSAGDAASAQEQALGGVESVFKSNAEKVKKWADEGAMNVGLSKTAYMSLAAPVGAALKGMGLSLDDATDRTKGLIERAADLSATFGGSTQEAVEAMGAALRGEMDPLERYGIKLSAAAVDAKALSMGLVESTVDMDALKTAQLAQEKAFRASEEAIAKYGETSLEGRNAANQLELANAKVAEIMAGQTGEITNAAKAQAAMQLIAEQSADAQGAFAREADTAAGAAERSKAQWENLTAQLGEALLPVMTTVGTVLQDVFKWVSDNQTAVMILAGVIGGLALGVQVVNAGFALYRTALIVGAAAQWALNAAMTANPIGIIIVAIGALVAAFVWLWNNSEGFRNFFIGMWEGIKSVVGTVVDWIVTRWNDIVKFFQDLPGNIGKALSSIGETIGNAFKGAMNMAIDAINWLIDRANSVVDSINNVSPLPDIPHIPKLGRMHSGGVVPGPAGSERLAILQAGETVFPANQRGNIGGGGLTIKSDGTQFGDALLEVIKMAVRRNGGDTSALGV